MQPAIRDLVPADWHSVCSGQQRREATAETDLLVSASRQPDAMRRPIDAIYGTSRRCAYIRV